jgi:ATP-dependent DNA helicase DinG
MYRYFSEQAIVELRLAIAEAKGNEVFFVGRTDGQQLVTRVEPVARGNRDAVPAIMALTACGDVAIHNHPSGDVTPSRPDLEIASVLGNQGVGFYIIDNGATCCYQVVAPFVQRAVTYLQSAEIEAFFAPSGVLATRLSEFEYREEQVRMALAVTESFNANRIALVEAGTGTGKSLAYLYPAILWATRNQERIVISTNTINLQEQLIRKDLPFLRHHAGLEFRSVLIKGRGNYLCLRKLATIQAEPTLFATEREQELAAIIAWAATSGEGCKSDLGFLPHHELWEDICCEADQCGRVKCPDYAQCFYYAARRNAAGADLLVVNHALLMADLAVRQEAGEASAVLPPFTRLIIDEGHHLEDVATNHLAMRVGQALLQKPLAKLQQPRRPQQGLLPLLLTQLTRELPEEQDLLYQEVAAIIEGDLLPGALSLATATSAEFDNLALAVAGHLRATANTDQTLRLTPALHGSSLWQETGERVLRLREQIEQYAHGLSSLLKTCDLLPDTVAQKVNSVLVDLKGIQGRLLRLSEQLAFFVTTSDDACRWYELRRSRQGPQLKLCAAPLAVAGILQQAIMERFPTVVLTSATLAVGERFDYLKDQTGIRGCNPERVTELLLPSPFDYARQAFIGLPHDLPEPNQRGYREAIIAAVREAIIISRGRAFVLFTSYELLTATHAALQEPAAGAGLTLLRQGEADRHRLLARFRQEQNCVLLGTDSFWEGVDVKGRALEMVIITRLPFKVPTEPIQEARAEYVTAQGGDPFRQLTIPQAVIKFKQGVGRLIRSRWDRGAVLVLDSRIVTKNYGRSFLKALPVGVMQTAPWNEVTTGLQHFFAASPDAG